MKHALIILSALAFVGCSKKEAPKAVYVPPAALTAGIPTGEFNAKKVADLEQIKTTSADPTERAIAEMLIISQQSMMGGTLKPEEIRARIEALIAANPGTWISASSRIGLIETYNPTTQYQRRLDVLNGLLDDPGLSEMGNASDPYQKPFLGGNESQHISANPRDYALYLLAYTHTSGYDLAGAEATVAKIKSDYWKDRSANHLGQLRQLPPEVLAKRREAFMKGQKS
jgi:hypothetical protein